MFVCSIPDEHLDPRRTALFLARSILPEVRKGVRKLIPLDKQVTTMPNIRASGMRGPGQLKIPRLGGLSTITTSGSSSGEIADHTSHLMHLADSARGVQGQAHDEAMASLRTCRCLDLGQ